MHGVVDREPATDDLERVLGQQRIEVNINLADGIISTVCVMV